MCPSRRPTCLSRSRDFLILRNRSHTVRPVTDSEHAILAWRRYEFIHFGNITTCMLICYIIGIHIIFSSVKFVCDRSDVCMKITHVSVRCQNRGQSVSVSQREILNGPVVRDCIRQKTKKNVHGIWIKPNSSSERFIFEIKNIIKNILCMKLRSATYVRRAAVATAACHGSVWFFDLRLFQY